MGTIDYSEDNLRKWFSENADETLLSTEDAFILAMGESCFAYSEPYPGAAPRGSYGDLYEDVASPAELLVPLGKGGIYVRMEAFAEFVLKELVSGVVFEVASTAVPGLNIISYIETAVSFVNASAKNIRKLDGIEYDFCQYLLKTKYTYADRLRKLFHREDVGFSLEEAIEQYRFQLKDELPESQERIKVAADELIKKNILSSSETGGYYINF